jgi:hypothetical protein
MPAIPVELMLNKMAVLTLTERKFTSSNGRAEIRRSDQISAKISLVVAVTDAGLFANDFSPDTSTH